MLGYLYSSSSDDFTMSPVERVAVKSKREVLSCLARHFDPLGLVLPVTVRGKLLLRDIWKLKLDWDQLLPDFLSGEWEKLYRDLITLVSFRFPRRALSVLDSVSLIVFTDSSKLLYGFTAYTSTESGGSHLVFAKSKVSPVKSKSLPTLELLAVFLVFKCIESLLDSLTGIAIDSIYIGIDSQIVLTWVLSECVKAKNIFARNRVSDISLVRKRLLEERDLTCQFKYIPTDLNPADLLTRGLSSKEFTKKFAFWIHGPDFINVRPIIWPTSNLGCLSDENKILTQCSVVDDTEPLFPLNRFSSLNKLIRVTSLVMLFIEKLRKTCVVESSLAV